MKPSRKASRLIKEFQHAAEQSFVIGCMAPEHWPEIKRNYRNTKAALRDYVALMEERFLKL